MGYEFDRAMMEASRNAAEDAYFEARPQIDCNDRRKVFDAGYERGWEERNREVMALQAKLEEHGKEAVGRFTVSQGKSMNQVINYETGLTDGDYRLYSAPQPAIPEGMALVSTEIINRFPEINPGNYDHEGVCALNAWGVELVLSIDAAAGVKP